MFGKFFSKKDVKPDGYEKGKELFELGGKAADASDFQSAFDYYSKSIEACENPTPYLGRARILFKRIRYWEALGDLVMARTLDVLQGRQFLEEIDRDIELAKLHITNYENGIREQLIADYEKSDDISHIARRILLVSFGVPKAAWGWVTHTNPLFEYHFFNELDNIKLFEKLSEYPEAQEYFRGYPDDFIQLKIDEKIDRAEYEKAEILLHSFLCSYDEEVMRRLRRSMLYSIHENLLGRDYGYTGLGSDCHGVTKEAYEYLVEHHGIEPGSLVI